ncbi:MAG: HIT family protein [Candidatus Pacearchaeota archaeon]
MEDKDCIFCKIVKGEIPSNKVYEGENFIGILDINPKAEGHSLIISKKHYRNLLDISTDLGNEIISAFKEIALKLKEEGKAEGFNLVVNNEPDAGQVIMHAHLHVIPRKRGDGLRGIV